MKVQLKLPTEIKATYKIITPMFIGNANKQATGISPQSFKGALRFWWRALAWSRIRSEKGDDEEALKELHEKERKIFGSADGFESGGKGEVIIKIANTNLTKQTAGKSHIILNQRDKKSKKWIYNPACYLGFGVMTYNGKLTRDCINEDQEFDVILLSSNDKNLQEVQNALLALGLLGGLGSKMRKGYGSLSLQSMKDNKGQVWEKPKDKQQYFDQIYQLLNEIKHTSNIPPFSAITNHSSVHCILKKGTSYNILNEYGTAMMMYRSWGKYGKVLGLPSEQNFRDDHHWSKTDVSNNLRDKHNLHEFHPQRVIFGLPHNYYGIQVGRKLLNNKYGRRSSPLIFHVHQLGNEYFGVATLLKSAFLPIDEKILADNNTVDQKIEWKVLEENFIFDKKRFKGSDQLFPNINRSNASD